MHKEQKLNQLRDLAKEIYEDLSSEALVGVLSTVITENQLDVLIEHFREEVKDVKSQA